MTMVSTGPASNGSAAKVYDVLPGVPRHRSVMRGTLLIASCLTVIASALAGQQQRPWSIAAAPEIAIGEDFGDDAYMFQSIAAARFLPDGRIVVADRGLLEVRIYGRDGKVLKRMGRRGEGPGEFSQIGGLWLTSKGKIAVWDGGNRRVTVLNPRGDLESTHRVIDNKTGGNLEVFLGSYGNDEIVLASLFHGSRAAEGGAVPDRWVLGRFSLDGEFIEAAGEVRGMWRYNRNPVPFTPLPVTVLHRDSILVADGYEGEITVRDKRGVVVRKIALPPVKEVSGDAAWSSLEARVRERNKIAPSAYLSLSVEILETKRVPRENRFPQVGGLLTDDRGYIWAKAYDPFVDALWLKEWALAPGSGGEWRVIRPDGGLVTTVRMPGTVRPLEIKGDRMLGVASDPLGVQRLVVHVLQS